LNATLTKKGRQPLDERSDQANLTNFLNIEDFEREAPHYLVRDAWDYLSGGAGSELTLKWNCEAFDRIKLCPSILTNVGTLDTRVNLFGCELVSPILLAPTGFQHKFHPNGEREVGRGAALSETLLVVSTFSLSSLEDIARDCQAPLWFQLYPNPDRGITDALIERAKKANYLALVITVDTPVPGIPSKRLKSRAKLLKDVRPKNLEGAKPVQLPNQTGVYHPCLDWTLTWKDIDRFCSLSGKMPVILKGILSRADAEEAIKHDVRGLIVSNHGARNLDSVPATIDVFPEISETTVEFRKNGGKLLLDGGIRRGTDILKAIALGADAIMVGRPYLYGLAVAGADGIARVVRILRTELESAMALTGVTKLRDAKKEVLWNYSPFACSCKAL
jgi:4-hydroxymandelate oxidase